MKALEDIEKVGREILQISFFILLSIVFKKDLSGSNVSILGVPSNLLPSLSGILAIVLFFLIIKFAFVIAEYRSRHLESRFADFLGEIDAESNGSGINRPPGMDRWYIEKARTHAKNHHTQQSRINAFAIDGLEVLVFISPIIVGVVTMIVARQEVVRFIFSMFEEFRQQLGF